MADSLIRWKKGDYIKLGKAVKEFNKKVKELQVDEINYLPDLRDYKELKNSILSRKELNRILNSLRKFNAETSAVKELPSGELLTEWEYKEIKKSQRRVINRLTKEKISIEAGLKYKGMGDERLSQIEATIRNIKNLESFKGFEFKDTKERISKLGVSDYELKIATQYKENFLNALEEMATYDNYEILRDKLEKIKNPIKFYEFVSQNEVLKDLFLYYKDKATSQTYGGFASNQDAFNYVLETLGLMR